MTTPLPDELFVRYSSGLPFQPDFLCFGWDDPKRFLSQKRYNSALLKASTSLASTAKKYLDSYRLADYPTLLHYRDRLLGKALILSLYNMQFVDRHQNQLTRHSSAFWDNKPFEAVWDYVPIDDSKYSFRYAAPLGTLAHYMKDLQLQDLYPLECISKTLDYVWDLLGFPRAFNSPASRHQHLIDKLAIPTQELNSIRKAALLLLSNDSSVQNNQHRFSLRRWLIGTNDARSIIARFILLEYNPALLEIASSYLEIDTSSQKKSTNTILSVLPPVGMPMLYMCFLIEGLVSAAQYITDLSPDTQSKLLSEILKGKSEEHRLISYVMCDYLVLSSDAANILSVFNTIQQAYDLRQSFLGEVMFWLSASERPVLESTGSTRLSAFSSYIDA